LNYVSDTVAGFIQAAASPRAVGQVINLGTGKAISVGELAHKIMALIGGEKRLVLEEARVRPEASEVAELICDNRKARELLGWEPRVSLTAGLEQTIRFIRDNLARYKPEIYHA
jgi:nucleoside-diphosphate-sugar epimerase